MFSRFFSTRWNLNTKSAGSGFLYAVTVLFFIVGCSPKIGERPAAPVAESFSGTSCLPATKKAFKKFINAEASESEVSEGWDCLGQVFVSFHKYVRGDNKDFYTSQELATFVEQNLLSPEDQGKITPALQKEVMKFKQIFLGGSREHIKRQEILDLVALMKSFKVLSLKALPHMIVYINKWQPDERNRQKFEDAKINLIEISKGLNGLILKNQDPYSLQDFSNLVLEFSKFFELGTNFQSISGAFSVGQKLKLAFLGGFENNIAPYEWEPLLSAGSRLYFQYLHYQYFIKNLDEKRRDQQIKEWSIVAGEVLDETLLLLDKKSTLVKNKNTSLPSGFQKNPKILYSEILEVAASLSKNFDSIPTSKELVDQVLKVKKTVLGGNEFDILIDEIRVAKDKLNPVENILLRLVSSEKIYFLSWDPSKFKRKEALRLFEEARVALDFSARELGQLMVADYNSYDLSALLKEIDRLYKTNNWGGSLESYLPLFNEVRNAIYKDTGTVVRVSQWSQSLGFASRVFSVYLFSKYFINGRDWSLDVYDSLDRIVLTTSHLIGDMLLVKSPEGFSVDEFARVGNELKILWPAFKSSPKLMAEIFKLKKALLGGNDQYLTHNEYKNFIEILTPAKNVIGHLFSYLDVLGRTWDLTDLDRATALGRFRDATDGFESELKNLSGFFKDSYRISDAMSLFAEIQSLYSLNSGWMTSVEKFLPLVLSAKNILFNDSDDEIKLTYWKPLFEIGVRGYSTYLYFYYFVSKTTWSDPLRYQDIEEVLSKATSVFDLVLNTKKSDRLTKIEINKLVDGIYDLSILPSSLKLPSIKKIVEAALDRLFVPPTLRIFGPKPEGLQKLHWNYVIAEIRTWLKTDRAILEIYQKANVQVLAFNRLEALIQQRIKKAPTAAEKNGLEEMLIVTRASIPMTLDSQDRLIISGDRSANFNLKTTQRHNMIRALVRLFAASYASDLNRIKKYLGVNLDEAKIAYGDFKGLLADFGFLDAQSIVTESFITNRFQEANIFMPHSDGNNLASFNEVHDLVFSIFSGLKLSSLLSKSLERDCVARKSKTISFDCLFENYTRQFQTVLVSMPDFLKFQRQLDQQEWLNYFLSSLKAVGYDGKGENPVKSSVYSLQPSLLQYVELIMTRFDINRDGFIVEREARRAFPLFQELLKLLVKKQLENGSLKESDLISLYCFILEYGKAPETTMETLSYLSYRDDPTKWSVKADRSRLVQIFGYIAERVRAAN